MGYEAQARLRAWIMTDRVKPKLVQRMGQNQNKFQ